jgi:hypothetical protein
MFGVIIFILTNIYFITLWFNNTYFINYYKDYDFSEIQFYHSKVIIILTNIYRITGVTLFVKLLYEFNIMLFMYFLELKKSIIVIFIYSV